MMLPCPFYQFTGYMCPFCGAQRGLVALWHGNVAEWWHYNPVLWCLMPYFGVLLAGELHKAWRQYAWMKFCYRNSTVLAVFGVLLAWGILRNIQFG